MRQKQISVPKTFFEEERDKFYSSWIEAFPREFVQNSVDAGARHISVRIDSAKAKGAFGEDPALDTVTRVVFEDDGVGMSRQVLTDVFFALGGSTKRGDDGSTGGFGRARIMQAFSQVRYSIRTRDCFVEGDGPNYDVVSPDEAAASLSGWASAARERAREARASGDDRLARRLDDAADQHDVDAALLRDEPESLRGCRFEVDLDPEAGSVDRRRPTVERVTKAFLDYFAKSDIKCRVTVNGVDVPAPARRMEGRKKLTATMSEGDIPEAFRKGKVEILDRADGRKDVVFGVIHTIKAKDARDDEKGYLNVRVRGASMFRDGSNSEHHALVLELVPAAAREVLTSNRDAMRSPYRGSVEEFTRMMATDASKALDSQEDEELTVLHGGQGLRRRERPDPARPVEDVRAANSTGEHIRELKEQAGRTNRHVNYNSWSWDSANEGGIEGVPMGEVREFLETLRREPSSTFLASHPDQQAVTALRQTLERQGDHAALVQASGTLLGHIVDNLKVERAERERRKAEAYKAKMAELNTVPTLRKDLTPPESHYPDAAVRKARRSSLLQASRRFDPVNWDPVTGKGKAPHQLLTAWTTMVDHSVDLLLQVLPQRKAFPYATGWSFSHKKWDYKAETGDYGWTNPGALHLLGDKSGDVHYFMLNPLDDETFKIAYDLRDPASVTRLWTTAVHEVAHVAAGDHNTAFAYVMTHMMSRATPAFMAAMMADLDQRNRAVSTLYGKGRAKVRPMDDEPGERPAERLLGGLVQESALTRHASGGFDVDADALGRFEPQAPELDDGYAPAPGMM